MSANLAISTSSGLSVEVRCRWTDPRTRGSSGLRLLVEQLHHKSFDPIKEVMSEWRSCSESFAVPLVVLVRGGHDRWR